MILYQFPELNDLRVEFPVASFSFGWKHGTGQYFFYIRVSKGFLFKTSLLYSGVQWRIRIIMFYIYIMYVVS